MFFSTKKNLSSCGSATSVENLSTLVSISKLHCTFFDKYFFFSNVYKIKNKSRNHCSKMFFIVF